MRYSLATTPVQPGATGDVRSPLGRSLHASVTVNDLRGVALTVYADATGAGEVGNPRSAFNGVLDGWVEAPDYDLVVSAPASGPTFESYTQKVRISDHVNVKSYGATGDGETDDTVAIQAAMDACIGAGAAASVTRAALNALYIPKGTYKLTGTLLIRSVLGLKVFGDGYYSRLMPSSAIAVTSLIDLDGLAHCSFADFRIEAESPTSGTVDNAIHLRWSTAASRSTTAVTFYRINIANTKFKRGFAIEQDDDSRQNDECLFEDCRITGQWTAGETTWWQYGMRFGAGTNGNVLNHHIIKGNLSRCAVGAAWAGSTGGMWGGGCQTNGTDFRGEAAGRSIHIQDVRSEGSERLWTHSGYSGSKSNVHLQDIEWYGNTMAADTKVIDHRTAGQLRLTDVFFLGCTANPTLDVGALGTPVPTLLVTLDGVQSRTAPGSLMTLTGGAEAVRMLNYAQTDASDVHVRSWPEYNVHAVPSVASAATIAIPALGTPKLVTITGTTTITSVTAGFPGQEVVLKFAGILTFTDGSNLKLAGNFDTSADDTIKLSCDGTSWFEVSRAVN